MTIFPLLKSQFLLNPEVAFLNHGSFGACPQSVFEAYQRFQRDLEYQPVEFLGRRANDLLDEARATLAGFLHVPANDLIFVPNATVGINTVARSLRLAPGDEILTTDQEYGAMDFTWEYMCRSTGARYIRQPIAMPVTTQEAFVEHLWSAVTERTKIIYLSHIASPTALIFPIAAICQRARAAGILTVVDGAHAPGQLPLDLTQIGVDIYTGNCHKWLCAPKGAGFLYVRGTLQDHIDPLIISWGYPDDTPQNQTDTHNRFVRRNQWQGTRDIAAYLSVPAAIAFQQSNDWETVRRECHALASETRQRIHEWSGLTPLAPDSPDWFMQMFTALLPPCDPVEVKRRLYDEYKVEVPLGERVGQPSIRVSVQCYNTREDMDRLLTGLKALVA